MQTIDVNQAKQRFPELIKQTISEGEVVITQEGKPVARLVAMIKPPRKQRRFGSAGGLIKMMDDFDAPLEDFKENTCRRRFRVCPASHREDSQGRGP